uniref:Uncharacterized protein n=1 Tax=Cacopsylla melanoneura TaxID=428564 RepID=A0A8D9E837_9HEMI
MGLGHGPSFASLCGLSLSETFAYPFGLLTLRPRPRLLLPMTLPWSVLTPITLGSSLLALPQALCSYSIARPLGPGPLTLWSCCLVPEQQNYLSMFISFYFQFSSVSPYRLFQ